MLEVRFDFTDSPPDSRNKHILTGVGYYLYDDEDNMVHSGEIGANGVVLPLSPGNYCITGTKYLNQESLYFGQLKFTVMSEYPPRPTFIMPPINYDTRFFVYLEIIVFNEEEGLPEIPCSDMHPSGGEDEGSWLWLILLLIAMGVAG